MTTQIITTPSGDRLVVLSERHYHALVEAAETNSDLAAIREFRRRLANGEEELLPSEMANRILAGESPVKVWREHRGFSASELARRTGLSQPYISQIETRARGIGRETRDVLADALSVTAEDLADEGR